VYVEYIYIERERERETRNIYNVDQNYVIFFTHSENDEFFSLFTNASDK